LNHRRTRAVLGATTLVLIGALGACSSQQAPSAAPSSPSSSASGEAADLVRWELRPPGLKIPRDDFGSAAVDGEIWVMGGMTGERGTRLDSIEVLDTRTGTWRTAPQTVPVGLASFETAAVGDRIYLFGGLDKDTKATDFSAVFDTSTGTWTDLPPLPHARYAHTVTEHRGRIFVIGGEGVAGAIGEVDIFDPSTGKWSSGAPMPSARGSHDTVSTGEVLYVLGGWLDAGPTDLVQTYDPGRNSWGRAAPLPEPVSRAGAAVLDGRIWVSYHTFSASLDLGNGSWSPASPLTVSRHGLGYIAVGDRIYGIGGCTEWPLRDVRTVDVLEPV
jgi:N-acetylneuraminic acid mutarotase